MADQKRILVVDDEKPLSTALQLKLTHEGFLAETADDGQEALDKAKATPYDLILLDLMMPNVDGFAVLAELQKLGHTTPVIVTTNLSQVEDKQKALSLGATEYIVKSDTPLTEIIAHIKRILNIS
ncbi:MAG: response regulator transcription factor [Weeksellaceae bacterium]